jgi:excisionase family DNA binding protein
MQERQQVHEASAGSSDVLLTTRQVEDRLHVDSSTLYRMASDGRLTAVKVGRQWRFPAGAVEALLTSGAPSAPASPPDSTVQAVLDVCASLLGVMMVATDMAGRPVSAVANPCPWFAERADDETTLMACTREWQVMADDLDFAPRFQLGALGFECARVFVRSGSELVGMVLVGGVAPQGSDTPGLYQLDADERQAVLDALPKVSAVLSRSASALRTGTTSVPE